MEKEDGTKGLTHIYCGGGKGKTTAALGLSLRAAGTGLRVLFVQFLKGRPTGELNSLELIPQITVRRAKVGEKFTFQMDAQEKEALWEEQTSCLRDAIDAVKSGNCDLLVLDEILGAVQTKTVDEALLEAFVKNKPEAVELVLTGREVPDCLFAQADYVSCIDAVKHPYEQGVPARSGIEF